MAAEGGGSYLALVEKGNAIVNNFITIEGLNQFMIETENLKNQVEQKRRSLSEGMSTKEEDTDERADDDDSFQNKNHNKINNSDLSSSAKIAN